MGQQGNSAGGYGVQFPAFQDGGPGFQPSNSDMSGVGQVAQLPGQVATLDSSLPGFQTGPVFQGSGPGFQGDPRFQGGPGFQPNMVSENSLPIFGGESGTVPQGDRFQGDTGGYDPFLGRSGGNMFQGNTGGYDPRFLGGPGGVMPFQGSGSGVSRVK